MKLRTGLLSLGIAGTLALSTSIAAMAAAGMMGSGGYPPGGGGYPGMMGGGGYPGSMGGGYPGMMSGVPGTGAENTGITTTTTTTDTGLTALPKAGGDPLSFTAAGSLLLSAGYGIRRKLRRE